MFPHLGVPASRRSLLHAHLTSVLVIGALGLGSPASAYQGRWTATRQLSGTPIHLVLLPGDGNPYDARVVWWTGDDHYGVFTGRQWGWRPASDGCTLWPSTSFDSIPLPDPNENLFCSGHTSSPASRASPIRNRQTAASTAPLYGPTIRRW